MSVAVALCGDGVRGCHGKTESTPNESESLGWHVRPWKDNLAEIPVLLHGERWVLLTEGGEYVSSEKP